MIYKYTNIDINKIKFSDKPYNKLQYINIGNEKIEKNIHYIDMYYNNDALFNINRLNKDYPNLSKVLMKEHYKKLNRNLIET